MTSVMFPHWSAQKESCLDVRSFKALNKYVDPKYVENKTLLKTLAMYSYIWDSL